MRLYWYEAWKGLIHPGRRRKAAFGGDEEARDC